MAVAVQRRKNFYENSINDNSSIIERVIADSWLRTYKMASNEGAVLESLEQYHKQLDAMLTECEKQLGVK